MSRPGVIPVSHENCLADVLRDVAPSSEGRERRTRVFPPSLCSALVESVGATPKVWIRRLPSTGHREWIPILSGAASTCSTLKVERHCCLCGNVFITLLDNLLPNPSRKTSLRPRLRNALRRMSSTSFQSGHFAQSHPRRLQPLAERARKVRKPGRRHLTQSMRHQGPVIGVRCGKTCSGGQVGWMKAFTTSWKFADRKSVV